jgi:hypothetical protein
MADRVAAQPVLSLIPREVKVPEGRQSGTAVTSTVRRRCNGIHAVKQPGPEANRMRLWSVDPNGQQGRAAGSEVAGREL